MWPICRPAAMRVHDAAMGSGGVGQEATPPFVMRTLYGQGRAKVASALTRARACAHTRARAHPRARARAHARARARAHARARARARA